MTLNAPEMPHNPDLDHVFSSFEDVKSTAQEMDRSKILRKLGLTETDVQYSMKLFAEVNPSGSQCTSKGVKIEQILGYSVNRLRRSKALRLMGVTEDEIELENSKNLGSLGNGGRKRSFIVITTQHQSSLFFSYNHKEKSEYRRRLSLDSARRRKKSGVSNKLDRKRRKSSTDFRTLKGITLQSSSL
jgi:hypothetical protein